MLQPPTAGVLPPTDVFGGGGQGGLEGLIGGFGPLMGMLPILALLQGNQGGQQQGPTTSQPKSTQAQGAGQNQAAGGGPNDVLQALSTISGLF